MRSSSGAVIGRHYLSGESIGIAWDGGVISRLEPAPPDRAEDWWIAPALFDCQVNGYAGIDFQRDANVEQLEHAAIRLREDGCSRFFLTLITDEWNCLLDRFRRLKSLQNQSPLLARAIAGWHIEGPFLSSEPGYCGAHSPRHMLDPRPEHFETIRTIAGDAPVLVTIAPERPESISAIRAARSQGIHISLGHTNAPGNLIDDALAAGATGFTHLGNACPRQLDRHDNILWRVLDRAPSTPLRIGIIPDGIHVAPELFRLFHRLIPSQQIVYTTDAMAAAGAEPGRYTIGELEVEVGTDQIVRQPGQTNFAGSALRPIDGVFRAAAMLRTAWQSVWNRFSVYPAQWLGLDCGLTPGAPARLCRIRTAPSPAGEQVVECECV